MPFWCKGKKDYCQDSSYEACNDCQYEDGSGGIELDDDDDIFIGKWISVKDRLPEGEALAANFLPGTYGYKEYIIGYVSRDCEEDEYIAENEHELLENVTHWMPLPEPPKEN